MKQTTQDQGKSVSGFSKMSKRRKVRWLVENFFKDPEAVANELKSYWRSEDEQEILDGISENTVSNYLLPYCIAPNFLINGKTYCVPMVIEESSVVAAASSAAKFWMSRGGITTEIIDTEKIGQVHFLWAGQAVKLLSIEAALKTRLIGSASSITQKMRERGGGIIDIHLIDMTDQLDNYYQLHVTFNTCDSMGANFINSVLELFAQELRNFIAEQDSFDAVEQEVEVIMSILSNYTPNCRVRATVSCPIEDLNMFQSCGLTAKEFTHRFEAAVNIAQVDPHRAATHNKGIMNGVDAVILATGNDFRAVEAGVHTYAARSGRYSSLSHCDISDDTFTFWLELPLAIGTVGGLTKLHPIAKRSLELLDYPTAEELMQVVAATGLAQNFAALRSLVTTGIQQGHMKMHLTNILNQLEATGSQKEKVRIHFTDKIVSFSAVRSYLESLNLSSKR